MTTNCNTGFTNINYFWNSRIVSLLYFYENALQIERDGERVPYLDNLGQTRTAFPRAFATMIFT